MFGQISLTKALNSWTHCGFGNVWRVSVKVLTDFTPWGWMIKWKWLVLTKRSIYKHVRYWSSLYFSHHLVAKSVFFYEWHFSSFFFLPLHSLEFWRVWRRDGIFCVACAGLRQGQTFEFYFCGTLCWKVPQKGGFGAAVPNCGDSYGNTVHNTLDTHSRAVTALLAFRNLLFVVERRDSCRKNSVFNLRIGVLLWKWGWTKVQWRGCSTKPRASWLAITHHQR